MKKRSALIVAAGLAVVLIAASGALSLGLLGASSAAGGDRPAPRVRTIHRTVTIHREAGPTGQALVLTAGSGNDAPESDDGSESEHEDDGGSGSDHEHEDDGGSDHGDGDEFEADDD